MNTYSRRRPSTLRLLALTAALVGAAGCASDSATDDAVAGTDPSPLSTERPIDDSGPATTSAATSTSGSNAATDDTSATTPVTDPATNTGVPDDTERSDDTSDGDTSNEDLLSADDVAGLLWMREEEQLAHDVYLALHELWGLRVFENITDSESSHIDAALAVMDTFGITDPAAGNERGEFTDPALQRLYDRLVAEGSASLVDALEVGAYIEELDIGDLRDRTDATGNDALIDLYERLERGSRNHLRAFTSQLESRDVAYEPTVLTSEAYELIVTGAMERGRGG